MGGASRDKRFADATRHLDVVAVVERMVEACPAFAPLLDDEVIAGLPCLQIAEIARGLVDFAKGGETRCVAPILEIGEEVLRVFGQEGRDFIGPCFAEGIPVGSEPLLKPFAGPLVLRELEAQES